MTPVMKNKTTPKSSYTWFYYSYIDNIQIFNLHLIVIPHYSWVSKRFTFLELLSSCPVNFVIRCFFPWWLYTCKFLHTSEYLCPLSFKYNFLWVKNSWYFPQTFGSLLLHWFMNLLQVWDDPFSLTMYTWLDFSAWMPIKFS